MANSQALLIQDDNRKLEELEELVYTPNHGLSDRQIDQFLVVARYGLIFRSVGR